MDERSTANQTGEPFKKFGWFSRLEVVKEISLHSKFFADLLDATSGRIFWRMT